MTDADPLKAPSATDPEDGAAALAEAFRGDPLKAPSATEPEDGAAATSPPNSGAGLKAPSATDPEDGAAGRRWTAGWILAAAAVAAMFVFWVWAFTPWARRENPARIDDRAFATAADARCADLQALIATLPTARSAATFQERADQVDRGTEAIQDLIADLGAAAAGLEAVTGSDGPPDAELVDRWLDDWDVYAADRRAHADRIREADASTADRDFRFLLSDTAPTGAYTSRMDGFARLNGMDNCQVPGDV